MYGVSPLSKAHAGCIPLGGTKIDISLSFEHSDEDQWLCGGNVLDLTNIRVGSTSERELRTHT